MDGQALSGDHRRQLVHGFAQQVEHAAEGLLAHRYRDGPTGVFYFHAAHNSVGGRHGHRAYLVPAQVLLHFGGQRDRLRPGGVVDHERREDGG